MFQNTNKEVLKELAKDNYTSHKSRNRIAILAIALTTLLITAVWTVGISMISTISNYGESAPGPGCEGNINGTEETRDKQGAAADPVGGHGKGMQQSRTSQSGVFGNGRAASGAG